ncbi:MAG: hypothetical protein U0P45_06305 [Acidimicrobiales bacterium]
MPAAATAFHVATLPAELPDGALVAVAVRAGRLEEDAPGLDLALADLAGFEGKVGQTLVAATDAGARLLVGVGDAVDTGSLRKVGAAVARAAKGHPVLLVALVDLVEDAGAGGGRRGARPGPGARHLSVRRLQGRPRRRPPRRGGRGGQGRQAGG